MTLAMLLDPRRVRVAVTLSTRRKVFDLLSDLLTVDSRISREKVLDALVAREKLGSTAIGKGAALPHAKTDAVSAPAAAVVLLKEPIAFASLDDVPIDIVIAVVAPAEGALLLLLPPIVKALRDGALLDELRAAGTPDEVCVALRGRLQP